MKEKGQTIKKEFLEDVITKEENLGLGDDTYAMAFKAFNWPRRAKLWP